MNRTAVDEIKARLPIEDVIGQYIKLEKAGRSFKARCPFHNEKTASFFVSPERNGYYCFGCAAKGDIFSFVEQFEGLDFRGALKILAEKAGIKLTYDRKADGERDRLFQVMEAAAAFFEASLSTSKDAQTYIQSRGISDETRSAFRVGWAPEGWRNLHDHLAGKGFSDSDLEKAGLVKKKEPESLASERHSHFYDRFRGRIMFPIADSSGRIIAFSGRILPRLDDETSAKYLNSPDTPLYDKSLVLYGLDKAKVHIRQLNYSVLVEGQMDLVMSHQAGVRNAVAVSGTALGPEGLSLVRRLSPNVVIAFDSDLAGRKAALRASGIALSLGMDVKIADIAGGKDPADLVREDPESWKRTLRATKQVIEFEIDSVLQEVADAKKLPRALQERVFPLIARIESTTERSRFVQMMNDKAGIPIAALWEDIRIVEQRLAHSDTTAVQSMPHAKTSSEQASRVDLVERRMFGLLALIEASDTARAGVYREKIRSAAGASYDSRAARIASIAADVSFEADAFFGSDKNRWDEHMKELILNFEEDLINEELALAMHQLRVAEKAGDHTRVIELAKTCQELSARKAVAIQKRRL